MSLKNILAGKAVAPILCILAVGGAFYYFKSSIKDTVDGIGDSITGTVKGAKDATVNEFSESGWGSIFSGMRASGIEDEKSSGGFVTDLQDMNSQFKFNLVDMLSPISGLISVGKIVYNKYKPTEQTNNPQSTGVPLLLKPLPAPIEYKDYEKIDDKVLDDFFSYTMKGVNRK